MVNYAPSLSANEIFLAAFSLSAVVQLIQGVAWKTWGFMIAFVLGSLCEVIGYSGRLMLHSNPWNYAGLVIQMFCLIVEPIFYSANISICVTCVTSRTQDHVEAWSGRVKLFQDSACVVPASR
ncbi:hypothetical protein V8E51_001325 [Hyaloscypha variabilis]